MHRQLAIVVFSALFGVALVQSCASRVPHEQEGHFPLEGAHAALTCESCHGLGGFQAIPADCNSCHEVHRPPNHYPGQDCADCHTVWGWLVFTEPGGEAHICMTDHDPCLPLIASHDVTCSDCHGGVADYTGLDATCSSCHEAERPPYHHDDQDCASCHQPTDWLEGKLHPVTLPHFDAACEDCHKDPRNRPDVTCTTGCHGEAETQAIHQGFYGYQYRDAACLNCHLIGLR